VSPDGKIFKYRCHLLLSRLCSSLCLKSGICVR
jgi:hypothetical protein